MFLPAVCPGINPWPLRCKVDFLVLSQRYTCSGPPQSLVHKSKTPDIALLMSVAENVKIVEGSKSLISSSCIKGAPLVVSLPAVNGLQVSVSAVCLPSVCGCEVRFQLYPKIYHKLQAHQGRQLLQTAIPECNWNMDASHFKTSPHLR